MCFYNMLQKNKYANENSKNIEIFQICHMANKSYVKRCLNLN